MAIQSISNSNAYSNYHQTQRTQNSSDGTQQRIQKRDGTGGGKQMNKTQNRQNAVNNTSAVGSAFDLRV
jgi:hypothetical protein